LSPTTAPTSSPSVVPSSALSLSPSASPSFAPSRMPLALSPFPSLAPVGPSISPASVVGFTSSQEIQGVSSSSFDQPAQDSFKSSVAAVMSEGQYDSSEVSILSITDSKTEDLSSSSALHSTRQQRLLLGQTLAVLVSFEITTVLEKTRFSTPSALVSNLQQFLSISLVDPAFKKRFTEKAVELGSLHINTTTPLVLGNVTSSLNFTVVVVETSPPTMVPIPRSEGSGGSDLPLPIWGSVLLAVGALAILGIVIVVIGRSRSSESKNRKRKTNTEGALKGEGGVMVLSQEADLSLGEVGVFAPPNGQQERSLVCDLEEIDLRDPEIGGIASEDRILPKSSETAVAL
jgi:hypothetical protein